MSEERRRKAEEFKKANQAESKVEERTKDDGTKEYKDPPTGEWVSKGELKKRTTARKKEADKATKEAAKAKKEEEKKASGEAPKKKVEAEELDPTKYTENRKNFIR
jgi:glutaminyl-tRNA synthetase